MSAAMDLMPQYDLVRSADNPAILADIYQAGVDFTLWQRTLNASLNRDINALLAQHQRFSFRVVVQAEQVKQSLMELLPTTPAQHFYDDVQMLVTMFADLFEVSAVGMRLELVDKTLCPLFHVDKVCARLVTTYHGAATEWLTEENINRQALSQRQHDQVMRDATKIQAANAGDVLLFKGQEWPQQNVAGIVHRSAQATIDARRLLLTLDLV